MLGEGVINRATLLRRLSGAIVRIVRDHPARVAIDGVDGAGKTTLADELVPYIQQRGRPVIRASVDGFHQSRSFRYRQGVDSPAGSMIARSITRNCVVRSWIRWGHEATGDTGRRYLTGAQINPFKSPNRKHPTMPSYYSTEFLHKGRS